MDNASREDQSKKNWQSTVKPSSSIYFLNGELIKILHSNRANNIGYIYNYNKNIEQSLLLTSLKKHRKRAFTFGNTLKIFKRSRIQFERMIKSGLIPKPTGATAGGNREWQKMSYYSEDDLFKIRDTMANTHIGRPRKDGKITASKNIPTEKDLRSLLGDAIMLYTRTKDGDYIPVWAEETW